MAINTLLQEKINDGEAVGNTTDQETVHAVNGERGLFLWAIALLTKIKDLLTGGVSVTLPTGAHTLTSTAAVSNGTVTAGASSVTFLPSSDFTGTIDGISYTGAAFQVIPFSATPGKTLPAIGYTRTAGTLNIHKLV